MAGGECARGASQGVERRCPTTLRSPSCNGQGAQCRDNRGRAVDDVSPARLVLAAPRRAHRDFSAVPRRGERSRASKASRSPRSSPLNPAAARSRTSSRRPSLVHSTGGVSRKRRPRSSAGRGRRLASRNGGPSPRAPGQAEHERDGETLALDVHALGRRALGGEPPSISSIHLTARRARALAAHRASRP